ncbi:YcaO-like family protein [Streptomyces sp. NRRL F-5727]|uniref:YcaO-like family protein n=1 Tax=Streptomyces sp. NRRL F-5727 TaxID=1463871 RepID=UPI00068F7BFC|nr:YcaO-like family protein [Streptomyces sp. NRRL F-5727]
MRSPDPKPGRGGTEPPAPGSGPLSRFVTRTRVARGLGGTPAALHLAVADLPEGPPWQSDRQTFGTSWESAQAATLRAVGEAVERTCGDAAPQPGRLLHGSYETLRRRGAAPLDPATLALYSPRQYATAGFPFTPFTRDAPAAWVEAHSLTRDAPVHVPAFLVYAAWRRMPAARAEPLYAFPPLGGTAAAATREQALLGALGEVVERDAAAVWWANAHPLPALPLTPELRALTGGGQRGFDIRLVGIDNEFGIPVVAAGVRSRDEGWLTYGFAARDSAPEAAAKALAEAYTLQHTCRTLDTPGTAPRTATRASALRPHRPDRRYLDSYRASTGEVAGMTEQLCHLQLHLDPRAAPRIAPWAWDLPTGRWPQERPHDRGLPAALRAVEAAGFEAVAVDLTTAEAAGAGLHACRVIVPGTVQAAPAAYPARGVRRMQDTAVRLGWRTHALEEEHLNSFPVPHA